MDKKLSDLFPPRVMKLLAYLCDMDNKPGYCWSSEGKYARLLRYMDEYISGEKITRPIQSPAFHPNPDEWWTAIENEIESYRAKSTTTR